MKKVSIGLLELGYRENKNSLVSGQHILDYALKADELNYSRFWLGEHHKPNPLTSYTNPEILISLIAGMTENIRIGSAGTLVKMYNPYMIVTNFKLLNNLFSNRIDLGLSKGNPDTKYTRKIYDLKDKHLFKNKIQEISKLFHNEEDNFVNEEIVIPPFGGNSPELWYLSNSYKNFNDAIQYRLNYCRSLMHGQCSLNKNYNKEELLHYKSIFFNRNGVYPKISIAIGISRGETIKEAKKKYYGSI